MGRWSRSWAELLGMYRLAADGTPPAEFAGAALANSFVPKKR